MRESCLYINFQIVKKINNEQAKKKKLEKKQHGRFRVSSNSDKKGR